MLRSNPQSCFDLAQEAFSAGDYARAVVHSDAAWRSLAADDLATRRSSKLSAAHSIVVVTYHHSDGFLELLRSLRRYADDADYEVLLVNNGNSQLEALVDHLELTSTIVDPGFNYGASGARNLGAKYASGRNLVFIDDDGILGDGAIEALIECRERYRAVTVRGKIVPKTSSTRVGGHYDRGHRVVPSLPDTEGFCVWKAETFRFFGGFDPLLYGHEGVHLACKMFRLYGPRYFLYTPKAILFHDFHNDEADLIDKTARHDRNRSYLRYAGSRRDEIARTFNNARASLEVNGAFISTAKWANAPFVSDACLTVITTARNGAAFLADYTTSLKTQTHNNFEVVFVDDGSSDGTIEALRKLWGDDPRLRVIQCDGVGRGAALNTAVRAASHDICVIADVDDISVPHRLEWTAHYFDELPSASCCAFYCFNEAAAIRMSRPFCIDRASIRARALTGMPVSFPSFAFRKRHFSQPFDVALEAGIDCEWLFRNLLTSECDGDVVPLPAVYYRIHDQQITTSKRDIQRSQALQCVAELHARLFEDEMVVDHEAIALLSGWTPMETRTQLSITEAYVHRLSEVVDTYAGCDVRQARRQLHDALLERKSLLTPSNPSTATTDYGPLQARRVFWPFGYLAVAALGNAKDRKKFNADPAAFFDGLSNQQHKQLGLLFFPKKRG